MDTSLAEVAKTKNDKKKEALIKLYSNITTPVPPTIIGMLIEFTPE